VGARAWQRVQQLQRQKRRQQRRSDPAVADTGSLMQTHTLMCCGPPFSPMRRSFLCQQAKSIASVATAAPALVGQNPFAHARNLPEPTANDVEPSSIGTMETLVPLVRLQETMQAIRERLQVQKKDDANDTGGVTQLLQQIPAKENQFKSLFDRYSTGVSYKQRYLDQNAFLVYYTKGFDGPGRPPIEQQDDASSQKQTLQYGARNDAWVAWQDFLVEYDYFCRNKDSGTEDSSVEDLLEPLIRALRAFDDYLSLASAQDVAKAREELTIAR